MTILAHAGPGASWQAMVVVAGVALAVAVVLVAGGWLPLERPGDLVLPVGGAVALSSLAPLASAWISDAIGWGLPLAVVALAVLLVADFTRLELSAFSPLAMGGVALAAVSCVMLYAPLTIALHPPPDFLPLADDARVRIVSPPDGTTVPAGELVLVVEVTGGSVGPAHTPFEQLGDDPEEAGSLTVYVDGNREHARWSPACTAAEPCQRVEVTIDLLAGERQLTVELTRGDGIPLAPSVYDRIRLTAG